MNNNTSKPRRVRHIPDALRMPLVLSSNGKHDFTESLRLLSTYRQMPFNDWYQYFQINQAVTTLQHNTNSAVPKSIWFCTHFMYLESLQNLPNYLLENGNSQLCWLPVDFRHHQTTWLLHNSDYFYIYENTHSLSLSISCAAIESLSCLNSSKICFLGVE